MSAAIATTEPLLIRAGTTVQFKITLPDFPASAGWSLSYALRGGGSGINFTSTADGDDHSVIIAAAQTAQWSPGKYSFVATVGNGTEVYEARSGQTEILVNLATAREDHDPRSQARRTLDNINAVIEKRAGSSVLSSSVEGTQLSRIPHADLLILRDRYFSIVQREEMAAAGKSSRRNIFVRFT